MIRILKNNIQNFVGFKTKRKIIVFESDDWGSIRMPDIKTFNTLKSAGIPLEKSVYCKLDSLESNEDMEFLFELLLKYKDINGNHPIITANTVVANPDFDKIKKKHYKEYFFEPFTETLQKYPKHDKVFEYYKIGIANKLFFPQFHGREHVNIEMWLGLLNGNNSYFKLAFENNMWGLSNDVFHEFPKSIQATFDSLNDDFLSDTIVSGLKLFEDLFGYKSHSFVANNYIWNPTLNIALHANGIEYLQGMKYQILPKVGNHQRKKIWHYLGEKNKLNQYYLIRNCSFEPSIDNSDINKTLTEIRNAFLWNKPAIISTHRINFIGNLLESNRKKNLELFGLLLNTILKNWPDVEFLNSCELGEIIKNKEL